MPFYALQLQQLKQLHLYCPKKPFNPPRTTYQRGQLTRNHQLPPHLSVALYHATQHLGCGLLRGSHQAGLVAAQCDAERGSVRSQRSERWLLYCGEQRGKGGVGRQIGLAAHAVYHHHSKHADYCCLWDEGQRSRATTCRM